MVFKTRVTGIRTTQACGSISDRPDAIRVVGKLNRLDGDYGSDRIRGENVLCAPEDALMGVPPYSLEALYGPHRRALRVPRSSNVPKIAGSTSFHSAAAARREYRTACGRAAAPPPIRTARMFGFDETLVSLIAVVLITAANSYVDFRETQFGLASLS